MPDYTAETQYRTTSASEELLYEWADDLSAVALVNLTTKISALAKAPGGTGTFRVRVGGTPGAVDGTIVVAATTTDAAFALRGGSAVVANPNALSLIKLTGQVTAGAADIKGITIHIPEGAGDVVAPSIQNLTPAPGLFPGSRATAQQTAINFDVIDVTPGLQAVVLTLKYASSLETLTVHDGTRFLYPFDSATSVRGSITNGYHFTVLPRGGWADNIDRLHVYAVDAAGNLEGGLPA